MKKFNLYPLDTKTPFGRGYLLIVGCFLLSCTPVTKKTEPSKNYKVYEGNELIGGLCFGLSFFERWKC